MAWASLIDEQWVSRADLQDAVDTGVFTLAPGQSIPATDPNMWITCGDVPVWLNAYIDSTPWPYPVTDNEWPQKSWIKALAGFIWVEGDFICEQSTPFTLVQSITGFSSPQGIFWDAAGSQFVVVDVDDVNGNCYTFNPATITTYADRNVIPGLAGDHVLVHSWDAANRKVWMAGDSTGGAKVAHLATNTITTVAYGTNGAYTRLLCKLLDDIVYCGHGSTGTTTTIVRIDSATESIIDTIPISSIPSGNLYFNGAYGIERVGNEIWVYAEQRSPGSIGVYNLALTTLVTTITIPNIATWDNSVFWQSHFYDSEKNKWYVQDSGSNRWYVIDTLTKTVIKNSQLLNRGGKTNSGFSFRKNELTGELYMSGANVNSPGDLTPRVKTYVVDRNAPHNIKQMYVGIQFASLRLRPGTSELWAAVPGNVYSQGGPWATDGIIQKFIA